MTIEIHGYEAVGTSIVVHHTTTDETGFAWQWAWECTLEALAANQELLGYDDPGDAFEAMLQGWLHPEVELEHYDRATGRNVWTDVFEAIMSASQARVKEEVLAEGEGTARDPRSPQLRGLVATRDLRTDLRAAQAATRAALQVHEPGEVPARLRAPEVALLARMAAPQDPLGGALALLRGERADEVAEARDAFRASLNPEGRPV